jgi:hypothetical protein
VLADFAAISVVATVTAVVVAPAVVATVTAVVVAPAVVATVTAVVVAGLGALVAGAVAAVVVSRLGGVAAVVVAGLGALVAVPVAAVVVTGLGALVAVPVAAVVVTRPLVATVAPVVVARLRALVPVPGAAVVVALLAVLNHPRRIRSGRVGGRNERDRAGSRGNSENGGSGECGEKLHDQALHVVVVPRSCPLPGPIHDRTFVLALGGRVPRGEALSGLATQGSRFHLCWTRVSTAPLYPPADRGSAWETSSQNAGAAAIRKQPQIVSSSMCCHTESMFRLAVCTGLRELPQGAATRDQVLAVADDAWQPGSRSEVPP